MPRQTRALSPPVENPLWYKDAVIYELHVRAFADSDGDGIGDFPGLAEKLDYLQDLGVTALWLLPFYPSPQRDDGYDIADYTSVHPAYGTMKEFRDFLRQARERGIHVITELVLNHTSDQHPWFQRARRAHPGSRWRDFYVWSNTPEKYRDARIIFKDFEASNWTLDPVARAYYWHRFYSHQPDVNFDSAEARRAMLRVVDFWLRMGVSGLRLDAVPYLYEREGTNCENLPETHAFLKALRRHVDERFSNRMLLSEANQWPEDAAAYFGDGDECHMNFHFPLMPRLFMGINMEDRFPIIDILQQTPAVPDSCQWALFLRNHDELTLEMVTDEERDYMYRVYSQDRTARINLGIRRRLAPLLNNDRKKIELMNSLLFSLPGTPVLYYGDEIGMGDNFYLGDRNGVRTPMQWSADRNAGFSRANPQRLYLPVIIDPEYHYEAVNVDIQEANPDSLLWWMKRVISLRKQFKAFARGSLEFLHPDNRKVLAFVRRHEGETILVVCNLSRLAQHTLLDLSEFNGRAPVELFGHAEFHPIEKEPYPVTLGPYGCYWFSLEPRRVEKITLHTRPLEVVAPTLRLRGDWTNVLRKQMRGVLGNVLLAYMRKTRWFGGKARAIQGVEVQDVLPVPCGRYGANLLLLGVEYTEGEPESYVLPLTVEEGQGADRVEKETPQAVIARLEMAARGRHTPAVLYDALVDKTFCTELLDALSRRRRYAGEVGALLTSPTRAFRPLRGPRSAELEPAPLKAEQSNTSVVYGDRLVFKLFRRLGEGLNPDLEIGRFLTERASFAQVPAVGGALEYRTRRNAEPMTLGVLYQYVQGEGDAWRYTLDALGHYFERVLAHAEVQAPPVSEESLLALSRAELPSVAEETVGPYLISAQLLGQRTGELHAALASAPEDPTFAPEPFSLIYQRSRYHAMRALTVQTFQLLRARLAHLPQEAQEDARRVLEMEKDFVVSFQRLTKAKLATSRIRIHGDYHLGQVLFTGKDFVIIDFEGEPARPLGERRLKRSPMRDVAGMVRSFHYAAHAALSGQAPTVVRAEDLPHLQWWALLWYHWVSASFLRGYLGVQGAVALLPQKREELELLLDLFLLEKAIYEIGYELNNRPDWVSVPLQGILQLAETLP